MPADTLTIYHNPSCSKSRETLALIQASGIKPRVVEYLKTPPSEAELTAIVRKPLPVGVSFIGGRWDEPTLIGLAYAFEQATPGTRPAGVHPDDR